MVPQTKKYNKVHFQRIFLNYFQQFIDNKQYQIEALKKLNIDLNKQIDDLTNHISERDAIISLLLSGKLYKVFQCNYPPYAVAEELKISPKAVIKLAELLEMTNDDRLVIRVSRDNKPKPEKSETIVMFSSLGIGCLREGLEQIAKNKEQLTLFAEWIEDDDNVNVALDFDTDFSSREIMLASESALRQIWDTPEEDEAWKDL